jgi:hypothetical protein
VAAFEDRTRRLYGVQWHPEVRHSTFGQQLLDRFLHDGAGIGREWTTGNVIATQVARIREQIGEARVICGLSGGVDSAVAAALVHKAVGEQLTCVFVDHGLLRAGEAEQVEKDYVAATGVDLVVVDAASTFLAARRPNARSSDGSSSGPSRARPVTWSPPRTTTPRTARAVRCATSCRAPCTPMSWSPAAGRAPQ